MSLLVLDPEIAEAEALRQQLTDLEFKTFATVDADVARELARKGGVRILICVDCAVPADLPAGLTVVAATRDPLSVEAMQTSLAAGAQDCWQLPLADRDMQAGVERLLDRQQRWLSEVSSEFQGMRSELERDQRAGQFIQLGMLPPNPMGIGHFRLQHRVQPSLILSGDFVDYFQITDRHFACYVADVAGHGASSAFVTVLLKNFSRRLRREYRTSMLKNPGEVLAWINNELIDQEIDKHVAMFFAVVDTQENVLHYANAAHFPPAMLVAGENVLSLEQKGKPLGIFPDVQYDSVRVDFAPGSRVVVFSDGVLDLLPEASLQDKERYLLEAVAACEDMEMLWQSLDPAKLGPDDVSCLLISHAA